MADEKKHILIVEDEVPMQEALTDICKNLGLEITVAGDGKTGLDIALEKKPQLILLDILMPKINGMEMLKMLRQDEWGRKVPVIMLTNVNPSSDNTLNAISQYQPAYYLIKSDVTLNAVSDKIKELLFPNDSTK